MPIALGWVQRKKWAVLDSKAGILQLQEKPDVGDDEKLVRLLAERKEATVASLSPELQDAFRLLKGRKLLDVEEKTRWEIEITDLGREALKKTRRRRRGGDAVDAGFDREWKMARCEVSEV